MPGHVRCAHAASRGREPALLPRRGAVHGIAGRAPGRQRPEVVVEATPLRIGCREADGQTGGMPSLVDDVRWPVRSARLVLRPAEVGDLKATWRIRRLESVGGGG